MSLKTVTGFCLALALAATLAWGAISVGRPGREAPLVQRRAWAQRLLSATVVGIVSLVGAGIGSVLLLRAAREEYRIASRRNLEGLVTGIRSDKEEKNND